MPWWAYQTAVEGLLWEQPWVQPVVMLDPERMQTQPFADDAEVVEPGEAFVGVPYVPEAAS